MSSSRLRIVLSTLVIGAAGILVAGETPVAEAFENDPICAAVACPGGARACADITIPGAEQCEDPEVMCCVPDEPTVKRCTESAAMN